MFWEIRIIEPNQVHPSDVFGPSIPGPIVFIVDCPTESHARVLLSSESLNVPVMRNGFRNYIQLSMSWLAMQWSCFKAFSKQFAENLLKIWEGGCWQCCEKSDMCLDLSYPSWSSCRVSKNTCFAARFVKGSSTWTNAGYRANAA